MKIFTHKNLLWISIVLLCVCIGFIVFLFNHYSLYKKSDIEKLLGSQDADICYSLFDYDPSEYFTVDELTSRNYIFEYEYLDGNLQHKLRMETNGSVFLDGELLYEDRDKVIEFLIRYSKTGLFTSSPHSLFYRNYLCNRNMDFPGTGLLPNPYFRITLRAENYAIFRELFYLNLRFLDLPEGKAIVDMWQELARFGKDGAEILPTMIE